LSEKGKKYVDASASFAVVVTPLVYVRFLLL